MRPDSREARYRFKPRKEYYSWAVDLVKGRERPCYGGMRQVVKVGLSPLLTCGNQRRLR